MDGLLENAQSVKEYSFACVELGFEVRFMQRPRERVDQTKEILTLLYPCGDVDDATAADDGATVIGSGWARTRRRKKNKT